MSAGHTPGPWSYAAKPSEDPTCPEFVILRGTGYIATVDSSRSENTDNARLIAAAPEAVTFAEMVAEQSEQRHLRYAAREWLARARGETPKGETK